MKQQVRVGVFETNSSSTHAVTILTDDEYKQYQMNQLHISRYGDLIWQEEYDKLLAEATEGAKARLKRGWEDPNDYMYKDLHKHYKTLEAAIENSDLDYEINSRMYEYSDDYMEIEHAEKEINGVKVHALSVYGFDS